MKITHSSITGRIDIAPEVSDALDTGDAIVALESTLVAHGLPRPHNLQVAQRMQSEIRSAAAVPAMIAIMDGRIKIGLSDAELSSLANDDVLKVTRRDFASTISRRLTGATTVAGTMLAASWAGIDVLATGGIGGVHRGYRRDVSADLPELSRTSMVVVCSGAKAILSLSDTIEWLETYGVPIIGYRTTELPAFYSRSSGLRLEVHADTPEDVAHMILIQRELGLAGSCLVVVPVPQEAAIPLDEVERDITEALKIADSEKVRGKAITPFLLEQLVNLTDGASVRANVALLMNNARVASEIAVALNSRSRDK